MVVSFCGLVLSLNLTWATTSWVPGVVGTFACVFDVFGIRLPLSVKTTLLFSRPWTVTRVPAVVVLPRPMVAVPLPTAGLLPGWPLPSAFWPPLPLGVGVVAVGPVAVGVGVGVGVGGGVEPVAQLGALSLSLIRSPRLRGRAGGRRR